MSKKKAIPVEEKPKTLDEMSLEELNQELTSFLKKYKEFSDLIAKITPYRDVFKEIGKSHLNITDYYLEDIDKGFFKFINQCKEIGEMYIKKVSLIKAKKELNILI
jgi:UDP-N-acetylmuramate-alanine ligase